MKIKLLTASTALKEIILKNLDEVNTTQIVYLVSNTKIPNNIERRSGFGGIGDRINPKRRPG
jgi:hypothetical protein